MKLSFRTQLVLRYAGWFPGRQIDFSNCWETLAQNGLPIFEAAKDFHAEFGRLHIARNWIGLRLGHDLVIDLDDMVDYAKADLEHYESDVGSALLPVGYLAIDWSVFITPDGSLYAFYGTDRLRLGHGPLESLNNVCLHRFRRFEHEVSTRPRDSSADAIIHDIVEQATHDVKRLKG